MISPRGFGARGIYSGALAMALAGSGAVVVRSKESEIEELAEREAADIIINNADPSLKVGDYVQVGNASMLIVGRNDDAIVLRRCRNDRAEVISMDEAPGVFRITNPHAMSFAPEAGTIVDFKTKYQNDSPPERRTTREQERRRKRLKAIRLKQNAEDWANWHARYDGQGCTCHMGHPPCGYCIDMPQPPDDVT